MAEGGKRPTLSGAASTGQTGDTTIDPEGPSNLVTSTHQAYSLGHTSSTDSELLADNPNAPSRTLQMPNEEMSSLSNLSQSRLHYERQSSQASQSSQGSGSVRSLEEIHNSITVTMLAGLIRKAQNIENADVKTAQNHLNIVLARLTKYGMNADQLRQVINDLQESKKLAYKGYEMADNMEIKVLAVRIIWISTMYLNYPDSLEAGRDDCMYWLRKLYQLNAVIETFSSVANQTKEKLGLFNVFPWASGSKERWSSQPNPEENLIIQICELDEQIYNFLQAGGLLNSPGISWPVIPTFNLSPMKLAYDQRLLEAPMPLLTTIALPNYPQKYGFVDIAVCGHQAMLISKNCKHIALTDLNNDKKICFLYQSEKFGAAHEHPSTSLFGQDSSRAIHFTIENSNRAWMFTTNGGQQCSKLSGNLVCVNSDRTQASHSIDLNLERPESGNETQRKQSMCLVNVVSLNACHGTVTILASSNSRAWAIMFDTNNDHNDIRITPLNSHRDLLPLQSTKCCVLQGKLYVLHFNVNWNRYEGNQLEPGLYEFDLTTGHYSHCPVPIPLIDNHDGRITSISQELLLIETTPNDPYLETDATRRLSIIRIDSWAVLTTWKPTTNPKSLDGCLSSDRNMAAVLDGSNLYVFDLRTGQELSVKLGLDDSKRLSPFRICWYSDRFVLLTFKNTPEIHKLAIRVPHTSVLGH